LCSISITASARFVRSRLAAAVSFCECRSARLRYGTSAQQPPHHNSFLCRRCRAGPPADAEEAAFQTGAARAALQARVYADAPFAGVWRRRLALKAAAATVRMARRGEHESMLRDAFFLRTGADDAGPPGRMLIAWRVLDRAAPLADDAIAQVVDALQLKIDDALRSAIAGAQQLAT
jgi:hypothetical protein